MLSTVLEKTQTINEMQPAFHAEIIDSKTINTIENKLLKIFDEDKKLDFPVFIFINEDIIPRLAKFLAGQIKRPVAIGVAGATASGKSTFAMEVLEGIFDFQNKYCLKSVITRVNTDDYYYDRSEMVKAAGGFANFAQNYDLDVPGAFELDLLKKHIEQLVLGNDVLLPKYDMSGTARRFDNHILAKPSPIIISEGLFCLTDIIKDVFDFCIYVDVSSRVQKERFFRRAAERGLGDAAQRVFNNAMDKAEFYIKPSSKNADIIINGEALKEDYRHVTERFLEIIKEVHFQKMALR